MTHDEQFLASMHRTQDILLQGMAADLDGPDAGWLMVAVINQIVALERRIAESAERAALLAVLDAARQ